MYAFSSNDETRMLESRRNITNTQVIMLVMSTITKELIFGYSSQNGKLIGHLPHN